MFERSRKYIGYNDLWLMLLGVPAMAIVVSSILFSNLIIDGKQELIGECCLAAMVHVLSFWLVFREIFFMGVKKYGNQKKRYLFTGVMIGVAYAIVDPILKYFLEPFYLEIHAYANKPHLFLEAIAAFLVTTVVVLVYEGSYLTRRLKDVQIEKQMLETKNVASQLEGLKNKVSPHFLFNSLNTLCNLIPESPERAESFVRKLSKVYRYTLEIGDKKLIPLKDEIDYLSSYTFLLKERFVNNIQIDVNVDEKYLSRMVIPMALQILMENAIKHNIISKDQPLSIQIFVDEQEKLVVKNNLQKKSHVSSSTKFGLENIKDRYRFFTDKSVDVIPTAEHFIVILPLIKND